MKSSKEILISLFILFFIIFSKLYSQDIQQGEFMIVNNTGTSGGHNITVKIYPSGAIFNGDYGYTLLAKNPIDPYNNQYIFGKEVVLSNDQGSGNYFTVANFDKTWEKTGCSFSLGYGLYKIDILVDNDIVNWCYVDFSDYNYCVNIPNSNYFHRLVIECDIDNSIYFKYLDNNGNSTNRIPVDCDQVNIWEQYGTGHGEQVQNKDGFTDYVDDQPPYLYHDFPVSALLLPGNIGHENPEKFYVNLSVKWQQANLRTNQSLLFSNCVFKIDNKNFTVNNTYQTISISGEEGKLLTTNGTVITMPYDFTISILNNASIESYGTAFTGSNENTFWGQIYLENPKRTIFDNCTFRNGTYPINSVNNYNNEFVLSNNYFYQGVRVLSKCVQLWNAYNVYITNNHFFLPTSISDPSLGILIANGASVGDENISPQDYKINVVDNNFYNGDQHLIIEGISNNLANILVNNNYFENGISNMSFTGCTGTISNNTVRSTTDFDIHYLSCAYLSGSSIDFRFNDFISKGVGIYILNCSYPNLAPVIVNDQYIWTGGYNRFEINRNEGANIHAADEINRGYFFIDNGRNNFTTQNHNNVYHIYGYLHTEDIIFPARNNCWYLTGGGGTSPKYLLFNSATPNSNMSLFLEPTSECPSMLDQIVDRFITNRGNGIYDTILISQINNNPSPTVDETLFSTGSVNQKSGNNSIAISHFKNILNNHPNSKFLEKSIFNLYECYVASDTNHNQGWRNVIFNDLKIFLENKIQQYEENEAFVNVAYDFLLKCKIKIKSYQQAMDGYDFIANNSPSATERLMASINYIDVEGLLQGSGSGMQGDGGLAEELNSNQNGKPIKDILLASYKKTKEQIKLNEKRDLKNSSDITTTKEELTKKHKYEKKLEDRAKENISISNSLTKSERRERIQKDLMLLHNRDGYTSKKTKSEISAPIKYELSQNYPNPFNPITNIKYQIQKTGLVTLKIYDLLGREIKTLVNEIKNPGRYVVSFNGSEFASGVYFYRIQSGDFVEVKKMVLLK